MPAAHAIALASTHHPARRTNLRSTTHCGTPSTGPRKNPITAASTSCSPVPIGGSPPGWPPMLTTVDGSMPSDQATSAPSTVAPTHERALTIGSGRRSTRHCA